MGSLANKGRVKPYQLLLAIRRRVVFNGLGVCSGALLVDTIDLNCHGDALRLGVSSRRASCAIVSADLPRSSVRTSRKKPGRGHNHVTLSFGSCVNTESENRRIGRARPPHSGR